MPYEAEEDDQYFLPDPDQMAMVQAYLMMGNGMPYSASLGAENLDNMTGMSGGYEDELDWQKNMANYLQDRMQMTADPIMAAYGGPGSFDPTAFEPTVTNEALDRPGQRRLDLWLNSMPGSVQQRIAQDILDGMAPQQAFGRVQELIMGDEELDDPELEAQRAQLRMSMPQYVDDMGEMRPDMGALWEEVMQLDENLAADPALNPDSDFQDEQGNWYRQNVEQSPLAERFRSLGLPLPTETYSDEEYLPSMMDTGWEQRISDYQGAEEEYQVAEQIYRQSNDQLRSATDAYDRYMQSGRETEDRIATAQAPGAQWQQQIRALGYDVNPDYKGSGPSQEAFQTAYAGQRDQVNATRHRAVLPGQENEWDILRKPEARGSELNENTMRRARETHGGDQRRRYAARQARNDAGNKAFDKDWASQAGTLAGMRSAGRTPLNDALMQRRMAAQALFGGNG
jgi:hypothetical protein